MITTFTAVIGGIGAGKSVVSNILRAMGYPVYDCDLRAKQIMDSRCDIHEQLCSAIHPEAVVNHCVNRPLISKIVFSDPRALQRLNNIVHHAVLLDLQEWKSKHSATYSHIFVETAIPVSSCIINIVDDAWLVDAPINIRIERVQRRNNLSVEQIQARINAQKSEIPSSNHKIFTLVNDNVTPLLPQILGIV
jgi:dephospho-CoA kinase